MNDEIKEINIKIPGQILDYVDTKEHLLDLFNYITNLRQENERLKTIKPCMLNFQECYAVKDYKSRCEKAIEYLDKVETLATLDGKIIFSINIFRNILQNGSDSQ